MVEIDAEAAERIHRIGRIGDKHLLLRPQCVSRQGGQNSGLNFAAHKPLRADSLQLSLHSNGGRGLSDQEQIASTLGNQLLEPRVESFCAARHGRNLTRSRLPRS